MTAHDSRRVDLTTSPRPGATSISDDSSLAQDPADALYSRSLPVIDEDSMELYRLVTKRGYLNLNEVFEVSELVDAGNDKAIESGQLGEWIETLLRLRLLRRAPDNPEILFPVSPETAQAELLSPLDLDITRRQQAIERARRRFFNMPLTDKSSSQRTWFSSTSRRLSL